MHHRFKSCHVMSCHVMSCDVMSCHVMSCYVISCHVMSCYVMSCHVMSFFVEIISYFLWESASEQVQQHRPKFPINFHQLSLRSRNSCTVSPYKHNCSKNCCAVDTYIHTCTTNCYAVSTYMHTCSTNTALSFQILIQCVYVIVQHDNNCRMAMRCMHNLTLSSDE